VTATLVANLATAYFQLRELDLELEISKRTFRSRSDSLQLTETPEQHGIDSLLDIRQSEQLVYTAATEIPDFERQIAQQENAISILLGNNPGDVPRGLRLTEEPHAPEVPAGLPSSLLERRPDVREAEESLIAANAQIGVARAAYFPQILTHGNRRSRESRADESVHAPGWHMEFGCLPNSADIRRRKAQVKCSSDRGTARADAFDLRTNDSGAFRDVSNGLVAYRKNREFRVQQEHLLESAQDAARLSEVRFKARTTDYLEVLTNETNSFSAELGLAQAMAMAKAGEPNGAQEFPTRRSVVSRPSRQQRSFHRAIARFGNAHGNRRHSSDYSGVVGIADMLSLSS